MNRIYYTEKLKLEILSLSLSLSLSLNILLFQKKFLFYKFLKQSFFFTWGEIYQSKKFLK